MTVFISTLAFILLLTVLILIHEWGHFIAARISSVTVEEFGFGLPPRMKRLFKRGDTVYSINWIPFGGFVRLKGENAPSHSERLSEGSFSSVSVWKRILILCAGVIMNILLAIALLTIGFSAGKWIPTYSSLDDMESSAEKGVIDLTLGVLIRDVISGGSAAKAGVPAESWLYSVDQIPVSRPEQVAEIQSGKSRVSYAVRTGKGWEKEELFSVDLEGGKSGIEITVFPALLSASDRTIVTSFALALRESWVVSVQTVRGLGHMFKSLIFTGKIPEGIAGIVGIAQLTHASVQEGFMTYLRLVALLSLSLAVLNILPFPALDGGRLVFVFAEILSRRPVNRRLELLTNALGFIFLIFLLVLVTFYDVVRLFS